MLPLLTDCRPCSFLRQICKCSIKKGGTSSSRERREGISRFFDSGPAQWQTCCHMPNHKPWPRRSKATPQDIADIRDALDLAHDSAVDHREAGQVIYDKAGRALNRIATALFGNPERGAR